MKVHFTINGVPVEAEADANVLDTARKYGFDIPSLCHHEAVEPYGACRLCLVEINARGRGKITTSCTYRVSEGISVITESPEIHKHRAMVLNLILGQAPNSRQIKQPAASYGIQISGFSKYKSPDAVTEQASVRRIPNCILCGLCARVCSEVIGVNALTFFGRGETRNIGGPYFEPPRDCIGCGACVTICPTHCIEMVDTPKTRMIWGREFKRVACERCGQPVMTDAYREFAIRTRSLPPEYYGMCAKCKRETLAVHFSKVGTVSGI